MSRNKRKALGRGIAALIPSADAPSSPPDRETRSAAGELYLCPIERVRPQRAQPRRYFDEDALEELAQSIREQGVVQPLIVRESDDGDFELIAGERRWRAAQRAKLHEVPVLIREASDLETFELALVENLQRQDLNPIEEAEAYQRLLDEHGYTQEQLADRVGRDRSTVANALRLLKLPEVGKRALVAGSIAAGHARALLALEKARPIQRALKSVVDKQLSVRQTEALVRKLKAPAEEGKDERLSSSSGPSANMRDLQERLSRALATRVVMHGDAKKGRIEVHYASLDELDRLLEVLMP
ncbi:MAG: chromosome partitioning protein ParB [Proteobacteria bacterium]|nr:MAG: chromosome partitioning protein ParB [Pseudomonadota bacterium]PIE19135.1 MAG: chromosome partitioning protein ParB [Pseudomonadota bacterium]